MAQSKGNQASPEEPAPVLDRTVRVLTQFERFSWDIAGVLALAFALMTLTGLVAPDLADGLLLSWWLDLLLVWLGWGSIWVVVTLAVGGLWMLRRRLLAVAPALPWVRIVALEAAAFSSMALMAAIGSIELARAEQGLDGGRVGWSLAEITRRFLAGVGLNSPVWTGLIWAFILLVSLLIGLGLAGPLVAWAGRVAHISKRQDAQAIGEMLGEGIAVSAGDEMLEESKPEKPARKQRNIIPPQFRKRFQVRQTERDKPVKPPQRDERLPSLKLLSDEKAARPDERHINQTAGLIEKTLDEFGIPAKVVDFKIGPTVTQFAVVPGFMEKGGDEVQHKVRVSQITSLQRDLALALSAQRLRIQAPVPGRPYVGIEVPNSRAELVRLRPILETEAFYKIGSPLAIALGRDVSGQPVVADLTRMPHLLIAGTTGSGKSVCIAALTICLVMNNPPEELQLVMVDPKMVELVRFNGLPHLIGKVETDLERILAVLRWTVAEMDRRYKLLEDAHARNIDTYNRKVKRRKGEEPLPRLVVMIDELADLMMSAPDQTEHNLVRLAQMARATGIHLIVATQRPSTDVVTGLIKANFPARISFAVASSIDSRVILDTTGAEALLGRGDMLFLPPEAASPVRSQGALVTDDEVERVIQAWQKAAQQSAQAAETETPPWEELLEEDAFLEERDDLVLQAMKIVQETQRASASMLQRRLRVGYPRAARLVDELEELGVVGPSQGAGREREVLLGPDDEIPFGAEHSVQDD